MTTREKVTFTCDHPGCPETLIVLIDPGHWRHAPEEAAENRGWFVTDQVVLCPEHDITLLS